ncbi:MAG: UDP-N-acetylglucosamine 2-epimerase (non-hydrolyzing) [Thermoplasmata archaeon]
MRTAVVVGTRPEIIKMSPIIRALEERNMEHDVIHTGQHYDHKVSNIFFQELDLEKPAVNLDVGSGKQGEQTGRALIGLERTFDELNTDVVLVQGDTNTVLAGALAGVKMGLTVGHVEAGLRSYDYRMPEEYNRRLADHASKLLFAPTEHSADLLKEENVWGDIYVTGNTVIDACMQNMGIALEKAEFDFDVPDDYVLITAHRAENVDDEKVLQNFIDVFEEIDHEMVYPMHPRAEKMFENFGLLNRLNEVSGMHVVKPQGYFEFLLLMKGCRYILTDSGGIQEEATAPNIGKKVFVLRESTERPEAVDAGYAEVVGTDSENILCSIENFEERDWNPKGCPYGKGGTGEKIVDIISKVC